MFTPHVACVCETIVTVGCGHATTVITCIRSIAALPAQSDIFQRRVIVYPAQTSTVNASVVMVAVKIVASQLSVAVKVAAVGIVPLQATLTLAGPAAITGKILSTTI